MPIDKLTGDFTTPTRAELVAKYERDHKLFRPGAKTGEGTQVNVNAKIAADQLLPLYARADNLARLANLRDMTSTQLEDEAERIGLSRRLAATGAVGFVAVKASSGGGVVVEGDECADPNNTSLRFKATTTGTYYDGDAVPVVGISTGTESNLRAGFALQWSAPRAGIGSACTVVLQGDGSGLSGGHGVETDGEIVARIEDARANPAASGNDAEYQQEVRRTPNVAIQQVFTYPAIYGPGQTAITFTLRPSAPGGSRIPNATQQTLAYNHIRGQMPHDDTQILCDLIAHPITVAMRVEWTDEAAGWADSAPWPEYISASDGAWTVTTGTSPTSFVIEELGLTGTKRAPVAGQTIAFYDAPNKTFRRKRILTAVMVGPSYVTITCDTTNNASDTTYTPPINTRPCPWSDSLQAMVDVAIAEFDKFGPGEQVAPFDAETRQRRSPPSPDVWPSKMTGESLVPFYDMPEISEIDCAEPTLPYQTPVGAAADFSRLLTLGQLLVYSV